MNRVVNFIDKAEEILFVDNNQSLEETLGKDFNKLIDQYIAKQDIRIFKKPVSELLDYFDKEAYGWSDFGLDTVIDDLSLSKKDLFIQEYSKEYFHIRWMTLEDNETGYMYFLIDAERTVYRGVEQYLKLGDYFRFAFSDNGSDYLVIMLKVK
ncbi:MAG: hypothetical protein J6X50_05010 [Bacilli bacterium]|nr:hypothetical protein [Bacilli bacterium]